MRTNELSNLELLQKLESTKNDNKFIDEILKEINLRLDLNKLDFKGKENKYLYYYMLLSNKRNNTTNLNELLKKEEFIKSIDIAGINGSTIIFLTNKCSKPRTTLLKNSQNILNSILNNDELFASQDFLNDLSSKEIEILRENQEVDNYLISHGLRFDTLKESTIRQLTSDFQIFLNYNIDTIRDFANNYKEPKDIANNPKFLSIYFNKLDDNFKEDNKLFKKLTLKQVKEIKKDITDLAALHLIKDASPSIQEYLLKDKRVKRVLIDCNEISVLNKLPKEYLVSLLTEKENILSGINLLMLNNLNKSELSRVAKNNKHFYSELVEKIAKNANLDFKPFISALPEELLTDLCTNHLNDFNYEVLKKLLNSNKKFFKDSILKSKEVSNYLLNIEEAADLIELLDDSDFNNEEKIRLLINCEESNNSRNICAVLKTIPENLRLPIYKIDDLRNTILSEPSFKLDSYTTKYLLNNYEELEDKPLSLVIDLLVSSDTEFATTLLENDKILNLIFKEGSKKPVELERLLKSKPSLITYFEKNEVKKYYNAETLTALKTILDPNEMNKICTDEVLNNIYQDQELLKVYKKLSNSNAYLLNTLDFSFINNNTKDLKYAILDTYTKYPNIESSIVAINNIFPLSNEFITSFYFATSALNIKTIEDILEVLKSSAEGTNRKQVGNILKMLNIISPKEISKTNMNKLIDYLLYFIPRSSEVKKAIIKTPISFNEIIKYNDEVNNKLTTLISKKENVKNNFLFKHYRLTTEEANNIINNYSIAKLDNNVYKEEYEFLSNLNKIFNTEDNELINLDSKTKSITMYESVLMEEKIKQAYAKIYNYELKSKSNLTKPFMVEAFGKELKIYPCPTDFLFLISNIDITEEYNKTNSFLLGWHNTINKLENIKANLIANDNLHLTDDIVFGFNGLREDGLIEISPYYNGITKFMTPRELIDNTRDLNNHLLLNKYAIRTNYNNSNLPNIEPDYILVDATHLDDKNYLEKISRASEDFKTKRNKEGLPIIAIDAERIAESEIKKIDNVYQKYQRKHDMTLLHFIITKVNNNYTAYSSNEKLAELFNFSIISKTIIDRIDSSNSIPEIEYIENLLKEEENKYKYVVNESKIIDDIREIEKAIKNRTSKLNGDK